MERLGALEDLRAVACKCGAQKKPMESFCYTCYKALPRDTQKDLYKRFEQGYVTVYEQAVDTLTELGRVK